jgi:FK506-binding nuclear protein
LKRPRESDAMETDEAGPEKLSKAERKRRKKRKASDGEAVAAGESISTASKAAGEGEEKGTGEKDKGKKNKTEKETASKKDKGKAGGEMKELASGLKLKDVKTGNGPQAKNGNKVSMRYIGRLPDGSIFDKNTSGKPVGFTHHSYFGLLFTDHCLVYVPLG